MVRKHRMEEHIANRDKTKTESANRNSRKSVNTSRTSRVWHFSTRSFAEVGLIQRLVFDWRWAGMPPKASRVTLTPQKRAAWRPTLRIPQQQGFGLNATPSVMGRTHRVIGYRSALMHDYGRVRKRYTVALLHICGRNHSGSRKLVDTNYITCGHTGMAPRFYSAYGMWR